MKKSTTARKWRPAVQIAFLVLIAMIAVGHGLEETGKAPEWWPSASLHSVCPFGGVVSVYELVTQGTMTKKIHESSFVLMGIVLVLAILFGPVFCGWVCPMGTVQEWVSKLGRKIFGRKHNRFVPPKLDRRLRYLRYLVLAWVVFMTARSGVLVFEAVDPYYALFNFWTGEVAISGFVILGVVLALSLFVERPFCKYACPYGALLGVFNLFRVFDIRRQASTCISCSACTKACPMNIDVENAGTVRDHQCISCLECTSETACPVPKTVALQIGKEVK